MPWFRLRNWRVSIIRSRRYENCEWHCAKRRRIEEDNNIPVPRANVSFAGRRLVSGGNRARRSRYATFNEWTIGCFCNNSRCKCSRESMKLTAWSTNSTWKLGYLHSLRRRNHRFKKAWRKERRGSLTQTGITPICVTNFANSQHC